MCVDSGESEGLQRKTYRVNDISPGTAFPVTVTDVDQNPVKGLAFGYSVDGGSQKTAKTDGSGNMSLIGPAVKTKIDLTLG